MGSLRSYLIATIISVFALSAFAFGDPWTLENIHAADYRAYDGGVIQLPEGFELYSSTGGREYGDIWDRDLTTYTFTAASAEFVACSWAYETYDFGGAYWDPAGYVLNGVFHQLSDDSLPYLGTEQGFLSVRLNPGDTFGFYVLSLDSLEGPGAITVTPTDIPVPEPSSLALLAAVVLGWAVRRRAIA